jgi:dCMP deaminase
MDDKWDRRFLELAKHISSWSKDPSTKCGAVIVNDDKIVVGIGYNGFARGIEDSDERLNNRPLKYELVVHAEVNAILMAGNKAKGSTLYVWPTFMLPPVCTGCCKTAIQVGIKSIIGYEVDESNERALRWKDSILLSREMCTEAGIIYRGIKE